MSEVSVAFKAVTKRFGRLTAVDAVSFAVPAGKYVVIVGPSGSGKTTTLALLGGFEEPDEGEVWLNGELVNRVPAHRRNTATVFQHYALFPHMNVLRNVEFGLRMRGVDRAERRMRGLRMLETVGLAGFEARMPDQLSGGQRQRVALARALVLQPSVLLLDEPLAALDAALRRQMRNELKALQEQVGITFVHITHDQEEAMSMADDLIVLDRGRVEDHGAPERVYEAPRSAFAATFIGENNLFQATIRDVRDAVVVVESTLGRFELAGGRWADRSSGKVGDAIVFAVRPERLRLHVPSGSGNRIRNVTIRRVVHGGAHFSVIADAPGHGAVTLYTGDRPTVGSAIDLSFEARDAVILKEGLPAGPERQGDA